MRLSLSWCKPSNHFGAYWCMFYNKREGVALWFGVGRLLVFWGDHSVGRHKGLYCCYRAAKYHVEWKE